MPHAWVKETAVTGVFVKEAAVSGAWSAEAAQAGVWGAELGPDVWNWTGVDDLKWNEDDTVWE